MKVKTIIFEDFINYKKASMYIAFPNCSFKCGKGLCQNSELANQESIDISYERIIEKYLSNNLTNAIVFAGLEPFDDFLDMYMLISKFREYTDDDIVIYTGYNKDEIDTGINVIREFNNIIIKFGRYIPNQEPHYDEVLGIKLASDNQYAERIS